MVPSVSGKPLNLSRSKSSAVSPKKSVNVVHSDEEPVTPSNTSEKENIENTVLSGGSLSVNLSRAVRGKGKRSMSSISVEPLQELQSNVDSNTRCLKTIKQEKV